SPGCFWAGSQFLGLSTIEPPELDSLQRALRLGAALGARVGTLVTGTLPLDSIGSPQPGQTTTGKVPSGTEAAFMQMGGVPRMARLTFEECLTPVSVPAGSWASAACSRSARGLRQLSRPMGRSSPR